MSRPKNSAVVGVSDHCGWAILVTATADGKLLDRRRVELIDEDLPKLPYHHDAQALPLKEAEKLIERVRLSAEKHAKLALDAVESSVGARIQGIALRTCPPLPETIEGRLKDYRAQNVADTVMYRTALADAARTRGWRVHWYEARKTQVGPDLRSQIGPPWNNDHRVAMAAAIAAE